MRFADLYERHLSRTVIKYLNNRKPSAAASAANAVAAAGLYSVN